MPGSYFKHPAGYEEVIFRQVDILVDLRMPHHPNPGHVGSTLGRLLGTTFKHGLDAVFLEIYWHLVGNEALLAPILKQKV